MLSAQTSRVPSSLSSVFPPSPADARQGTASHPTGIEKSFKDQHFPEEGLNHGKAERRQVLGVWAKGFVNARGGIQWNNDSSSNNDVDGVCDLGKDISEVLAVSLRL